MAHRMRLAGIEYPLRALLPATPLLPFPGEASPGNLRARRVASTAPPTAEATPHLLARGGACAVGRRARAAGLDQWASLPDPVEDHAHGALHLTLQDVDLVDGVLSIHQSKFRKSRLVPVSTGTLDLLRRYHDLRVAVAAADPAGAFFVSGRGTAYSTSTVQAMFHDLTAQAGLRGLEGRGPRLHDLRSTFAVTRLLQWYRDGEDVMARLPLLSTYLGHACVSDTEVYLCITTALLEEASTRFHAFAEGLLPPTGGQS